MLWLIWASRESGAAAATGELDDTLEEGHTLLAQIRAFLDWEWDSAEREFHRALQLNPNSADSRAHYWFLLAATKRPREARAQIDRALELDPLNPMFQGLLAWQFRLEGRHADAILQTAGL
jgi:Tfp pilus assembly protein PilF